MTAPIEPAQGWIRHARNQSDPALKSAAERGQAIAALLEDLGADKPLQSAALCFPLVECGAIDRGLIETELGGEIAGLVGELDKLYLFGLPANWDPTGGLSAEQADNLRKMLVAIVSDVRLVLVRLADQLYRLRSLKKGAADERRRAAMETREVFAPLANRLGIWQLKWELDDLAFRFLEPDTYQKIAARLHERRVDRENYIAGVCRELDGMLREAGINGKVAGRPKHIYSIWRKMQRKDIEFERVFDVRAVRVLVESVADCYAVLGLVHSNWSYLPGEFDDYIALPKDNLYQSLHTAVIGPEGKPLEIQIRTAGMNEHAELGVAAHWRYKEGVARDVAMEQKIAWLRQLLGPIEQGEPAADFLDRVKSDILEDRVYVVTPQGDVIDLPQGATPIDFAYAVHTQVGHHCRGAKVNGRMVQLTHQLASGDQVEVITARNSNPSRDWLIPQLGFLASGRTRSKVRAWFRQQDIDQNRRNGRALLERELSRLGVKDHSHAKLARTLKFKDADGLYAALGTGDATLAAVAGAIQRTSEEASRERQLRRTRPRRGRRSGINVSGVGDLMCQFSRCCGPVPPEPIQGYITVGRGVSIHRRDCGNMLRLAAARADRVIEVGWENNDEQSYPVNIVIEAYDRQGLLRDISTVLADESIGISANRSRSERETHSARIELTLEIRGLDELSRAMLRLERLANVYRVYRS